MPRPKSDLTIASVYLGPDDRERAELIARRLGYVVAAGKSIGQPDKSAAIREALRRAEKATRGKAGK